MQSHDMDMCFTAHGSLFHCATNGALIPNELRDIPTFNSVRSLISNRLPVCEVADVDFNEEYLDLLVKTQRAIIDNYNMQDNYWRDSLRIDISDDAIRANYISSFVEMAIRGAHSYDHSETERIADNVIKESYVLVVKPNMRIQGEPVIDIFREVNIDIPDLSDIVELTDNSLTITVNLLNY